MMLFVHWNKKILKERKKKRIIAISQNQKFVFLLISPKIELFTLVKINVVN